MDRRGVVDRGYDSLAGSLGYRSGYRSGWAWLAAIALMLIPLPVAAQATALDPAVLEAAQAATARVAPLLSTGRGAAVAVGTDEPGGDTDDDTDAAEEPAPVPEQEPAQEEPDTPEQEPIGGSPMPEQEPSEEEPDPPAEEDDNTVGQPAPKLELPGLEPDLPGEPIPEVEEPAQEPESTPESSEEPDASAGLDLTDRVAYSEQGFSFEAPADWIITFNDSAFGDDLIFELETPDTDLIAAFQGGGVDFPGVVGVVLMRSLADLLLEEYVDGAVLVSNEIIATQQGLPLAKITFAGEFEGEEAAGAFYVLAPGATAYMLLSVAPADQWETVAPGIDLIAESMTFDDDLLTLQQATDGTLDYSTTDGLITLTVPEGWYVAETNDITLPVVAANAEADFAVAFGIDPAFDEELGPELDELLETPAGETTPELEALVDELVAVLGVPGEDLELDEEQSELFAREGAVIIRLVGNAALDTDVALPIALYFDLRTDGAVAAVVFGDIEAALADETTLLQLVESVALSE